MAGTALAVGDVNGDGIADIVISAPIANLYAGSVYVLFGHTAQWAPAFNLGNLNGVNGFRLDDVNSVDNGGDMAGLSVAVGDINGDGMADIIIGMYPGGGAGGPGNPYVVFGARSFLRGSYTLDNNATTGIIDGIRGFALSGASAGGDVGIGVAAGDINGDGKADVIISSTGSSSVYVYYGQKQPATWDVSNPTTPFWPNPYDLTKLNP